MIGRFAGLASSTQQKGPGLVGRQPTTCTQSRAHSSVHPTMPKRSKPAVDDEAQAERKRAKAVRLGVGTSDTFSAHHKHPRRSTRPIISKANKSARLQAVSEAKVAAEVRAKLRLHAGRIKTLRKLLSRHESAGRTSDASTTRDQIDAINAEMRVLEMELIAPSCGDEHEGAGDAADGAPMG